MFYSIGEFTALTQLGIHTLRYYEQEELIVPERNAANRRRYAAKDIEWAEFIKRLKETGMPIKEIKRYALLRAAGDESLGERMAMLVQHRQQLNRQIALLLQHQEKLDLKIDIYREKIARHEQDGRA
ncbi:MAG: MerR family transcriptional regulator [Neisseria sp.]|nr:MerR family transcriptional regulator [Neisseria sp.]